MSDRNPYAISFGRIPHQYISRDVILGSIVDSLKSDVIEEQAFKLTGIRGTGKTVMLSAIEKELRGDDQWILCDIKPGGDITADIVSQLYEEVPFIRDYIDGNFNLSAFGIGIGIKKKTTPVSLDTAIKKIMKEIDKKKKRVLVAIDEVRKTPQLIDFIQEFQILIREELPIFLIIAGLYEDIESIENSEGLTFFLRAEKYEMTPLNITVIREDYKNTLGLKQDVAEELAVMTKGYAFAYQAFGKYMWESKEKIISDVILSQVDEALSQKVYDKIWSELRPQDKWFLGYIAERDSMSVEELLDITSKKHNEWSGSRARLIEKGILDGKVRGKITVRLPRFKEYVEDHRE